MLYKEEREKKNPSLHPQKLFPNLSRGSTVANSTGFQFGCASVACSCLLHFQKRSGARSSLCPEARAPSPHVQLEDLLPFLLLLALEGDVAATMANVCRGT